MSVSRWRYTPACDDHMDECVGDCDLCSFEPEEMTREEAEELERLRREIRRIKIVLTLWFTGEALIHFLKLMGVLP